MKKYTFKRQLLFVVFMLLGCLAIHAADDDLITKQITVKLDEAGTLPDKIGGVKMYKITNLKVVGEINGTDVLFIRKMAGSNSDGEPTNGKLAFLDLSEAKIKAGGDNYITVYGTSCGTSDNCIGKYFLYSCSSLTDVVIPSSVTSIGWFAFEGCNHLTSFDIPSSVTSIGGDAFSYCRSLTSVNIPSSVTEIGDGAFSYCSSLTSVDIPSSVTSIDFFEGCSSLTSIDIPSSVTSIGGCAFWGCSSLTSIDIPSSVTKIGQSAFSGCSSLTSIEIPSSVTSIGDRAFANCSSLTSVYVSWETPLPIGTGSFSGFDKAACTLYVPQGTKDDYWLSSWGDEFDNIEEYDVTGMEHVVNSGEAKEVSRYSIDGKRLDAPAKGLNIVKYSDGSVKKIAVQ